MLDEEFGLRTFLEEHSSVTNRFQDSHTADTRISWLPDSIKDFILPAGFPGSDHEHSLFVSHFFFPVLSIFFFLCEPPISDSSENNPDFEIEEFRLLNGKCCHRICD